MCNIKNVVLVKVELPLDPLSHNFDSINIYCEKNSRVHFKGKL